jgi:hypothetical protein
MVTYVLKVDQVMSLDNILWMFQIPLDKQQKQFMFNGKSHHVRRSYRKKKQYKEIISL